MEKLVSGWTNGKGKVTDINIQTRTSYDKDAGKNIERLHQATVTYKNELDEVIKKTIAWRQIGTTTNAKGEEVALRGFVEVAGQYSKAIDTVSAKTDSFAEKQQKAVASAKNALSSIESKLHDPNITKSLAGTDFNANGLNSQLEKVRSAISVLDNASRDTFTQAKIDVDTEITSLNNLISTLKNAEYAATSLRTKGLETTKDVYASKLDVLVTKMKSSGAYTNGFHSGVDNLKNILNVATDTSGLTAFLNGFDKLEAGYKRAEASAKAFNQAQKVGINVSGLQSKITDLQRISPEIDNFKTNINGADVTVQSLYRDLEKVNTQSDLGVIKEKFKAFTDAAKSAGIAVTDVGNSASQSVKESSLLLKELEKSYQNIKNLQIQKSTLDPIVDSSKISKLNEEITKAKNDYNNAFRSASVNGNFDISAWKEIKSTIDSATKSKIEYNNAGKIDYLNEQKNNLSNTLSNLKSSLIENGLYTDELKQKIETLESELVNISNKGDLSTFKENLKSIESEIGTLSQVNKIQLSMEGKNTKSKNYDYQIDTEIKKLKDLGFTDEEVAQKVKILTDAQLELKRVMDSNDFDSVASKNKAIIESDKERTIALNQVRTAYGQLKNDTSQYYNLNKQTKLSTDIQNWLSKNSRASKEAKESLNAYYRELSNGRVSVDRLNYIEKELKDIDTVQRGLGKLGKNLKDQFKEAGASFTQWLSVSSGIMALVYQLQKIPKEVIVVNKAMVELTKVSDASSSDITKYFDEAADSAKRYGSTVSDMINATADWSRLGYNLPDAKKLAEVATLYTNVGDGIDMSTANESLISTLQGFKMTADEAIHVIDAFNEVANTEAINSAGIGEALQRSASSMYAAGNTLEETIGLVTAANAVVQDPDSIGTAYKTISMRIRGAKTEMEELGLETDGMVESTATLQEEIMALSGVDIMKDKDTFKSTYQILDELAVKWQDLTDIQQASITELIAGKRQGNIVSALMSNFDTARRATETAVNSTGSALKEQEEYEKGIEYSLKRLEASFQEFANHILDSSFIKGIVDFGNSAINVIDKITSKLGSLGTIGLGAGLFTSIKNVGMAELY